jgi:DNA polymerase I
MNILLLDAYNLIHRARSGFTKGDYAIIYNFFRGIRPLVEKFNPDKVYFVLEGYPQFRLELDEYYKSERKRPDESFLIQKNVIIDLVKRCLPIVSVRHPDFECDDVIATLAMMHCKKGDKCTIISSDSDFIQLHNICDLNIYNPIKKQFVEKPDYDYVIWKSLRGDPTDNISGIKGIGDKTALKIVKDEKLLAEVLKDEAKRKIFERNVNLIRLVNLSQKLDEMEFTYGVSAMDILYENFHSFEFSSMLVEKTWNKYCKTFEGLQVAGMR